MAQETFIVESPLSPAEVFARVADLTLVDQWDHGVRDPKQVSGDGPGLGARYEVTVRGFDGRPATVTYELTEFEPPTRFVMIGENDALRAHDTVEVAGAGSGSIVTYHAGLELLGDDPPLTDSELGALFSKVVAAPRDGLISFLAG